MNEEIRTHVFDGNAPTSVTEAVLKASEAVPDGSREVQGIDFNQYQDRSITVDELVSAMASMGFQASAIGEAVRIIKEMVRIHAMKLGASLTLTAGMERSGNRRQDHNFSGLHFEHDLIWA
jgi:deoxyhypusine synthase